MKKLFIIILMLPCMVNAQEQNIVVSKNSADKNTFQTDAATGIGLYNAFDNINHGKQSGINAAANLYSLKISYAIKDGFSVGTELKLQQFLTDDNDTSNVLIEAGGGAIQLHTDYHFTNLKKLNAYIGCGFGVAGFDYRRKFRDSLTIVTGEVNATGISISLNCGLRWYFANFIGLFTSVNFASYPMRYRSFTVDGSERENISFRRVDEAILNMRGFEGRIGLCFKIGMSNRKTSDF